MSTSALRSEVEVLKRRLLDRDVAIVQLETQMAQDRPDHFPQGQVAVLRAQCDHWQDKYDRWVCKIREIKLCNGYPLYLTYLYWDDVLSHHGRPPSHITVKHRNVGRENMWVWLDEICCPVLKVPHMFTTFNFQKGKSGKHDWLIGSRREGLQREWGLLGWWWMWLEQTCQTISNISMDTDFFKCKKVASFWQDLYR